MYKPFRNLLLGMQDQPMLEQKEILARKFTEWKGSTTQIDDILVIGIKIV